MEKGGKDYRSEKAKKELAVRYVINDLLNGATTSVVKQKMKDDLYGLGRSYGNIASYRILQDARTIIHQDTLDMIPTLRDDMLNRLLDVYTEAREVGDRGNALKALDQIAKITGLNEQKVKVDGHIQNEVIIDFGFEVDDGEYSN